MNIEPPGSLYTSSSSPLVVLLGDAPHHSCHSRKRKRMKMIFHFHPFIH